MRHRDGWLEVSYAGNDLAKVEIGTGQPVEWRPAFLDYGPDGERVAKVRGVAGPAVVRLRVDGVETSLGTIR